MPEGWRERFADGVDDLEGVGDKSDVSSEEVKPSASSILAAKSSSFSALVDELTVGLGLLGHFVR